MYKICVVTTVSMTLRAFALELAKSMVQRGNFEIHFVCDYDEQFALDLPEYIHYHPIAMKRGVSIGGYRAVIEMYKLFKKEKFDIVQYSTPNASLYASIAARFAKIKVRLYCQWGIFYVGLEGLKRRIFKIAEKMVCSNSTIIEPDSFGNLYFAREEKLYAVDKSRVIWNGSAGGVNFEKFDITKKKVWSQEIRARYQIPQEACVYIFIGRITKAKGINELLEASKELLQKYEDIWILLVGSIDTNASLDTQLYKWSREATRVIYAGFTNEVEKFVAASDVYVLPSYREGFGNAIIEAEAMGVPVIVTDIDGPTEAMKKDKTGLIVKKGDPVELYATMEKLYLSRELCFEMGQNGISFVAERFDQKILFQKMYQDRMDLILSSSTMCDEKIFER